MVIDVATVKYVIKLTHNDNSYLLIYHTQQNVFTRKGHLGK